MNLAYRDVRHSLGRFLLTCLGLGLLLGVVLAMIGNYRGLVIEALTLVQSLDADVWVVEKGTQGPFAEVSRVPGDTREAIARLAGVASAGSVTFQTVEAAGPAGKTRMTVVGYEPDRPGGPAHIVAGRGVGRSHYEMVVDFGTGLRLDDRTGSAAIRSASSASPGARSRRAAIRSAG